MWENFLQVVICALNQQSIYRDLSPVAKTHASVTQRMRVPPFTITTNDLLRKKKSVHMTLVSNGLEVLNTKGGMLIPMTKIMILLN